MKATAIHGYVAFVQREPEEKVTRKEAAEFLNEIALAIVSAGDIGDPKSQSFRAAIEKAVKEFTQPGGDTKPISAREAARRRMPLDGADAQALEGALTLTERERDALKEELEKLHRLAPTGTYTANATYEMQIADLKFRLEQAEEELRGEREDYARLRWEMEAGCENTPTKGCECPGCCTARERAERGEA